ncbi:hypothetical protein [Alkalibaculum sporogenes]|nr:hypothetical protein [Alkalibaculum sporogenes]
MKNIRRIGIIGCILLLVALNLVNTTEATNGVFDLRGKMFLIFSYLMS